VIVNLVILEQIRIVVGCFKIPPINKNNKGPQNVWKLANNAAEAQKNAPYLTIWAEGAGGLGEGSVGISPKLVQYYRGMADFFRRVDTDSEILKCNRLQLRVENPYIDGPTPVKNQVLLLLFLQNFLAIYQETSPCSLCPGRTNRGYNIVQIVQQNIQKSKLGVNVIRQRFLVIHHHPKKVYTNHILRVLMV